MTTSPVNNISTAQKELFRNPKYADLVVKCGSEEWKCHRAILCHRCPFFEAACGGAFKEVGDGVIVFKDDEPRGIKLLLTYLYTLEVPNFTKATEYDDEIEYCWDEAESAFILGDKYGLPTLRNAGKQWMIRNAKGLSNEWSPDEEEIKQSWVAFIQTIWSWQLDGAEQIRNAMLQAMIRISNVLIEDKGFQKMIRDIPDIHLDFLRALSAKVAAR